MKNYGYFVPITNYTAEALWVHPAETRLTVYRRPWVSVHLTSLSLVFGLSDCFFVRALSICSSLSISVLLCLSLCLGVSLSVFFIIFKFPYFSLLCLYLSLSVFLSMSVSPNVACRDDSWKYYLKSNGFLQARGKIGRILATSFWKKSTDFWFQLKILSVVLLFFLSSPSFYVVNSYSETEGFQKILCEKFELDPRWGHEMGILEILCKIRFLQDFTFQNRCCIKLLVETVFWKDCVKSNTTLSARGKIGRMLAGFFGKIWQIFGLSSKSCQSFGFSFCALPDLYYSFRFWKDELVENSVWKVWMAPRLGSWGEKFGFFLKKQFL